MALKPMSTLRDMAMNQTNLRVAVLGVRRRRRVMAKAVLVQTTAVMVVVAREDRMSMKDEGEWM